MLKALNFLQMWHSNIIDEGYYEWLKKHLVNEKINGNIYHWAHFLNQTFTPDMIEKYFEGWSERISKDGYINMEQGQAIGIEKYTIRIDFCAWKLPRTLDEFITLCQLANIELYWKEN